MRKSCLILLFCLPVLLWAEPVPSGYYNKAQGQSDAALKTALHDTIRGGMRFHYGTQGTSYTDGTYYTATWNYFPLTDQRADGTIWDMYSSTKRYFPYDGGSACGQQIEHCLPKSWWGWTSSDTGSSKRAYQDLYILNPADAQANGQKSNYPPGHVQRGDKFDNGSFRMDKAESSLYGWICFEPEECYRGDFARTWFYVVTAYQDLTWNPAYARYLGNESYLVFQPELIEVLLDWHRADPVSRKEIHRADAVSSLQHNRNPFIDYPELVEYIWGDKKGQKADFSQLVCTASSDYMPEEDFTNFTAYEPVNTIADGFTALWDNFQTDYTLDVYTRTCSGHNDTLVNLPALTAKLLDAHPLASYEGKLQSAGTNAVTMGASNTDGAVLLSGLQLTAPATLVFRANIFQTADAGELQIFLDGHQSADTTIVLPVSRDERRYTYTLPQGTDAVKILSVGGSTKKRACMQELYLVQGDLQETVTHLAGYPQEVVFDPMPHDACCTWQVAVPESYKNMPLYYRVITKEGRISNEQTVVFSGTTNLPAVQMQQQGNARIVLRNGTLYIFREGHYYTVLGQKVQQ